MAYIIGIRAALGGLGGVRIVGIGGWLQAALPTNRILLESGDALLLENGNRMELE